MLYVVERVKDLKNRLLQSSLSTEVGLLNNYISHIPVICVIYSGHCFEYDPQTAKDLCSTQCASLCGDNETYCEFECKPPYGGWYAECDRPGCQGTCMARRRYFNSAFLPSVPMFYNHEIVGNRLTLVWTPSYSSSRVLYVLQVKKMTDLDNWKTVAYEIHVPNHTMEVSEPCYSYHYRVMAVNMYGSQGFSVWAVVDSNEFVPTEIANISYVGSSVYYYPGTDEFMAIIQWDDSKDWPRSNVSLYSWNTHPTFQCEGQAISIAPIFEEINVNRTMKQLHHKVLFRILKDAYGCVFQTQVRALSTCGVEGVWTNFTVDLRDCNKIKNYPCSALSKTFVPATNVQNTTLCVRYQQPEILVDLRWQPPAFLGSEALDKYIIRWGNVKRTPFPGSSIFLSTPNVTYVDSSVTEKLIPISGDNKNKTYGFQIVPVAASQHIAETEWGMYTFHDIDVVPSYVNSDDGVLLLHEPGLTVYQVPSSLQIDASLQPLQRTMSYSSPWPSCPDDEGFIMRMGRLQKRPPPLQPILLDPISHHIPDVNCTVHVQMTLKYPEVDYGIKILCGYKDMNITDEEWEVAPALVFRSLPIQNEGQTKETNTGLYVATIVSITIFLIFLTTTIACRKRCVVKKKFQHLETGGGIEEDNPYYQLHRQLSSSETPAVVTDVWELPHSCVKVGYILGHGAFGLVFKGRISGGVLSNRNMSIPKQDVLPGNQISVAIKVLQENAINEYRQDFLREINMMKTIGSHKHIVSILGCCTLKDPICLIVEHMPHGDLLSYLRKIREVVLERDQSQNPYINRDVDVLSPTDLLSFARQIANGMDYLSQKGFVHRDLAARNILVGYNKTVKIGDFGLTRFIYNDAVYVNRKGGKLPFKWMSIEAIFALTFSVASDVWSFGVVLFEIVTLGGTPYPGINAQDILPKLRGGYRMERPENCSQEIYGIMLSCWQELPQCRPTFSELYSILDEMLFNCTETEYLNFNIDKSNEYYTINTNDMDDPVSDEATVTISSVSSPGDRPDDAKCVTNDCIQLQSPPRKSSDDNESNNIVMTTRSSDDKSVWEDHTDSGAENDKVRLGPLPPLSEWKNDSLIGNLFFDTCREHRDSGVDSVSYNGESPSSSPKTISSRGSQEDDVFLPEGNNGTHTAGGLPCNFIFTCQADQVTEEMCTMCSLSLSSKRNSLANISQVSTKGSDGWHLDASNRCFGDIDSGLSQDDTNSVKMSRENLRQNEMELQYFGNNILDTYM